MKTPIEAAFDRSRTTISVLLLILATGFASYISIPKESAPDIDIPIIYVLMRHDGISPEDAERLLIRPMEQELRSIEGVKEMRSRGYDSGASVILEFEAGFDVDKALRDVREQVDIAKPELPEETDEPSVREVNFSLFPVIDIFLSADIPRHALIRAARDLRDEIEGLAPVLGVNLSGDREEMLEILIDPITVQSYGISPEDVRTLVARSNKLVAAGAQDTGKGRFALKVPGLFETLDDILSLPVKITGDAVVTLGDIGEVRRSFKDPASIARVNGKSAVVLEVSKRTGENIIDTIRRVKEVVARERAAWPEALRNRVAVDYFQDRSKQIETRLADLRNNVISAVVLVMIVVVAALGFRSASLVGVAIPGSFLAAILALDMLGLTMNMVVLFSLILAVGMLVDGAIVVTEYADRKMAEGDHRRLAYALAAKRMSWPIIASTATTLAAFTPLIFWPGVVGEFMKYLPITMVLTLTASLAMALVFVPTLGAWFGRPGNVEPAAMKSLAGASTGALEDVGGWTGRYLHVLKIAIGHPIKLLAGALAILIVSYAAYLGFGKGFEFFPDEDQDFAILQVKARGNLSVYEMDELLTEVESRIADMPEIRVLYARSGEGARSEEAKDIIGVISLEFVDWRDRRTADDILEDIRNRTEDLAGIVVDRRKRESGPPVGKPVQIRLASRFPELLEPALARVLEGLKQIGGFTNVEDSRSPPGIDWVVNVDRAQAAKFGVDVEGVGMMVQMVSTGIKLGEYRPDDADDELDIRVRYPEKYRTIKQLDRIRLSSGEFGEVPIGNFVTREARPRIGTILRVDRRRVMNVKADVEEGLLADDKVAEIKTWMADEAKLDPRVAVTFKGEDEEQEKARAFLSKAFGVALFIMAVILVTQFNSFYSAFLILTAVIMSTVGVLLGLLATGRPFSIIMNGIGVVALAGIVVNNNIVLIDTYDRLVKTSKNARDAILRTGAQRLRPVLLTTVTTMLGLMPMTLGVNIDFITREVTVGAPSTQSWTRLATAIVFGLGVSTILTLVVTPALLMLKVNLRDRLDRRRKVRAESAEV